MNSTTAYVLSKKYTNETAEEFGGLKGANCQIQSIDPITGGKRITFSWVNTAGATRTSTLDVMDGAEGVSVASASINTVNNHLILTMTDSTTRDCGEVPTVQGEQGEDGKSAYEIAVEHGYSGTEEEWLASLKGEDGEEGFSPEITVKESTSSTYILTITNKEDSYDTPNLKGSGSGSASALSELTDVSLVSLTNGQILKYDTTIGKWKNEDGIEINSLGDIKDVDLANLQNGQIIQYNSTTHKWENADAVNPTQFSVMPNAEDYPQQIIQYTGTDTVDFKRGYFYRSTPTVVSGNVVYNWEQINVQTDNSDYEQLQNHPEINNVELTGNKTLDDLGVSEKLQYTTFPAASSANAGQIRQYCGISTATLKKGFWYQSAYNTELADYEWKNIDVSSNVQLESRVGTLEDNQGDMSTLEIGGVSDIVSALNALNGKGLSTITYTEPNLILTYEDGNVIRFNVRDSILSETQIGELANVTDTTIQNTNVLQYDSAILGYKPYDIVLALTNLLNSAKDYTDQEIAGAVQDDAFIVDAKPACSYDSSSGKYIVVYYQNGTVHTTEDTTARFYYKVSNDPYCTSWFVTGDSSVDPVEFTYLLSTPDFDDYVNKNTDIVSTYTTDMADKTKVPNVSALDALMALVNTALGLKINTASIIDALTSQDTTKVLSANQGYVLKGLIDKKQDQLQYTTMPSPSATLSGVMLQYSGVTSAAFKKGSFYVDTYDSENDVWYWKEIQFAPDMVAITAAEVDAMWA